MSLKAVALIYALFASAVGWGVVMTVGRGLLPPADTRRYLITWVILTVLMFMAPNGSLFLLAVPLVLLGLRASGADRVASAVFLVAAVPPGVVAVFDLPFGINYLLDFSFAFLLSAVLLAPVAFNPGAGGPIEPRLAARRRGVKATDLAAFGYLAIAMALGFRGATVTGGLRTMTVTIFVALIPYLAISRGIRTPMHLERVLTGLVACLVIAGIIGFFGSVIGWQIYDVVLRDVFGKFQAGTVYRAGLLRTGGTLGGSPISFGTMMAVGLFLAAGCGHRLRSVWHVRGLMVCLGLGLLASVSRGPMVGAAAGLVVYYAVKPNPAASLVKGGLAGIALLPLAFLTGTGRQLLAMLPFIGEENAGSVSYRQELAQNGWIVIKRYPLFGSKNYLEEPEMQALIQGQGIIDVVNAYLGEALKYGLIGGTLFALIYVTAMGSVFSALRKFEPGRPDHLREMGEALLAGLFAYALIIATTSLTGVLPYLGWMFPALCVAYARVARAAVAAGDARMVEDPTVAEPHDEQPTVASAPAIPEPAPVPDLVRDSAFVRSSIGPQQPFDFVWPGPPRGKEQP